MNDEKASQPITGAFYLGGKRLDTSDPETLEYVRSRFAAKPTLSLKNPCSVCGGPIVEGAFFGTGDGSMVAGGSFAHEACYWRQVAKEWEARAKTGGVKLDPSDAARGGILHRALDAYMDSLSRVQGHISNGDELDAMHAALTAAARPTEGSTAPGSGESHWHRMVNTVRHGENDFSGIAFIDDQKVGYTTAMVIAAVRALKAAMNAEPVADVFEYQEPDGSMRRFVSFRQPISEIPVGALLYSHPATTDDRDDDALSAAYALGKHEGRHGGAKPTTPSEIPTTPLVGIVEPTQREIEVWWRRVGAIGPRHAQERRHG